MIKVGRTVSGRLTQVAVAGALAVGLAGALASGPAASASPVARTAAAATTPTWRMQSPPEPADTSQQGFGSVACSSASACLALASDSYPVGELGTFAETWNGSRWTVRTVPNGQSNADLYGVKCRTAQWCMAVGTIKASGDDYAPVADRWNGSAFTQTKPPTPAGATNSDLASVACSSTTACTAIGEFAKGTGAPSPLADRWNGSAWNIQSIPAPSGGGGGDLSAVACPRADVCRAVGSDSRGLFSEAWHGSSWLIRPVPVPAGGSFAALVSVSCKGADFCEAVGTYSKGGTFRPLAEVWNGSHWLAQAPPTVSVAKGSGLNAVSCVSATDCEAAGEASTVTEGAASVGLLEKWNGTTWSVQEKVRPAGDATASLVGISCTKGPVCEAVGYHAKAVPNSKLLALRYTS